jgi:hypothetical protein
LFQRGADHRVIRKIGTPVKTRLAEGEIELFESLLTMLAPGQGQHAVCGCRGGNLGDDLAIAVDFSQAE